MLSSKEHHGTKPMFAVLVLEAAVGVVWEKNTASWLVAGGCCWSGVRGKHCWLVLEQNMVNLEV